MDSYGQTDFPFDETKEAEDELPGPLIIEKADVQKPYLGGYRDARNDKQYHHAYTETTGLSENRVRLSKWEGMGPGSRIERETQTSGSGITRSVQSYREAGAQTARRDVHHDATKDVEVVPRTYIDSEQVMQVRQTQALTIQCAIRCALARRTRARLQAERDAYKASLIAKAGEDAAAAAERAAADAYRRANPRTAEDFAVLYDEIEAWRLAETARIDAETAAIREAIEAVPLPPMGTLTGPEARDQRKKDLEGLAKRRSRQLAGIARREQELVARVERLRGTAIKENAISRVEKEMAAMTAPKAWATSGGDTVAVVTPFAARAAQLKALYDALAPPLIMTDKANPNARGPGRPLDATTGGPFDTTSRLDTLLHVKYTVREFDTALVREICTLIDREVDMMQRGRPAASLSGVRERLRSAFLAFCETPEFNPEAGRFARAPGGPLGALQGTANLTGKKSTALTAPWATGNLQGMATLGSTGPGGEKRVQHPFVGTSRDPRLLTIPSFMRPTLKKPAGE